MSSRPYNIIAIGSISDYRCYVGISRDEAVERYTREVGPLIPGEEVREITVNDGSFFAYDIWSA